MTRHGLLISLSLRCCTLLTSAARQCVTHGFCLSKTYVGPFLPSMYCVSCAADLHKAAGCCARALLSPVALRHAQRGLCCALQAVV